MSQLIFGNISDIEAIISILATIISGLFFLSKYFEGRRYKLKFSNLDSRTKKAIKCYIPTRAQITDPCDQDSDNNAASFELLPFFLAEFKNSETQYFMLLADSGMGKTTFLLKLYFVYRKKIFKKYRVVFFSLSQPNVIKKIKKIKHKSRTILLLDCLDEDRNAMDDYSKRIQELCDVTELFHKVIITCRTQFFPDSDSEPQETGRIKVGVGNKNIEFEKYYLSHFNNEEIDLYLNKKYTNFLNKKNVKKITRSKELIDSCPRLMYRPMLLSYIDDLILDSGKKYTYVYEIYHELVFKWVKRELVKNKLLYEFSEKVAEYMYLNKTTNIEADEIEKLCERYNINLRIIEAKSRSLLNRNANGNYKFAHKSILEFFLFEKAFKEVDFRKIITLNGFNGYDMLKHFIQEKSNAYLQNLMKSNPNKLQSGSFSFFQLPDIDFSDVDIIDCDFEGCNLSEANFMFAKLVNVNLCSANLIKANFRGANLRNVKLNYSVLKKGKLREANLKDVEMIGANLEEVNLEGANLEGANLEGACISKGILSFSNLEGANLSETNLSEAVLIEANLERTNLNGVDLRKTFLINSIYKDIEKVIDYSYMWMALSNAGSWIANWHQISLVGTIFSEKQIIYFEKKYNMRGTKVYIAEADELINYNDFSEKRKV